MTKAWLLLALVASFPAVSGTVGPGGLTGLPGLPFSDVMEQAGLCVRSGFGYAHTADGDNLTEVPIAACIGFAGEYEAGAAFSVRFPEDDGGSARMSDITLSGAMLYETARGGSALKLTGSVFLPTGEDMMDPGAGIAAGAVTSTTFRMFRFSAAGNFRLLGGQSPASSRWRDSVAFTFGGVSFLGDAASVFTSVSGDSEGTLEFMAGGSLEPWRELLLDISLTADMADHGGVAGLLGISWTFAGL